VVAGQGRRMGSCWPQGAELTAVMLCAADTNFTAIVPSVCAAEQTLALAAHTGRA